jgi:hypothetical protein
MKTVGWEVFEVSTNEGYRSSVAALSCFVYFAAHVHEIAGQLAEGLERYVEFVGLDTLKSYAAKSGIWKPMSKRQLDRDLKHLRNFPDDHVGMRILYDAGEGGEPGGFGVSIASEIYDEVFPKQATLMRLDWPPQGLVERGIDELIDFVATTCQMEYVQSAHVGLTFKTTPGSHGHAKPTILAMLARYYGFSPCEFCLYYRMRDHTLTAHWLNYLSDEMAAALGGPDKIVEALGECEVRKLPTGVLIRGAKLPPIGDINRKAPDLGALPEVARLLKPTRVDITKTYLQAGDFDAVGWIERMDDLYTRSWDNSDNSQEP